MLAVERGVTHEAEVEATAIQVEERALWEDEPLKVVRPRLQATCDDRVRERHSSSGCGVLEERDVYATSVEPVADLCVRDVVAGEASRCVLSGNVCPHDLGRLRKRVVIRLTWASSE